MRLLTVTVSHNDMVEVPDRFFDNTRKEKKETRMLEKQTIMKRVYDGNESTWDIINEDADMREL